MSFHYEYSEYIVFYFFRRSRKMRFIFESVEEYFEVNHWRKKMSKDCDYSVLPLVSDEEGVTPSESEEEEEEKSSSSSEDDDHSSDSKILRSPKIIDPYEGKEYREIWERFMKLTENGDVEEVNEIIENYDVGKLYEYQNDWKKKEVCSLCFTISRNRVDIMVKLLDKGLKRKGNCERNHCVALTSAECHNKKAMIELIARGWKWKSNCMMSQSTYASMIEPIVNLMEEIIKDTFSPTEIKPVKREL